MAVVVVVVVVPGFLVAFGGVFFHSLLCHYMHTSWHSGMNSYLEQEKMPSAVLLDLQAVPGSGGVEGNSHP